MALVSFVGAAGLARALNEPGGNAVSDDSVVCFLGPRRTVFAARKKWFRDMYDLARTQDQDAIDFNLTPPSEIRRATGIGYGFWSWSTRWLYLTLLAIALSCG